MPEHSRDACALWAAHTFLTDCTMISPRLAFSSPTKGCGKTTALDVMGQLVLRPLAAANVSPSAIFRVVEACHPTLLIDEADSFLKDNEELRGVLNSGHRRGGAVLRTVAVGDDFEVRSFSTYGAMVIALIGQLPGTLADRSVSIVLTRRKRSESVTPFRLDRVEHLVVLARKLARWAQDNAEAIAAVEPEMPAGLYNRAADNWRILLAIATAAGGDWLARGHKAALAGAGADVDEVSRLELLLGDTRNVFDELTSDTDRISSAHLIEKLCEIVPRPWGEYGKSGKPLTQNKLARLLKPLGIVPQKLRIGTETPNGYFRHQFVEAWERFLSLKGEFKPEHRNKCDEMGTSDVFQSGTAETDVPVRKSQKSNNDGLCSDIPVGEAGLGGESAKQSPSFVPVTFLGIEPFAPCAHCCKTGGVVHHVRDNRHLARPSVPLHEDCVADWFAAAELAPRAGDGSIGLSVRTIRELAGEYQERLYSQYQGRGSTDVDSRPLDAWLRQRVAALGVFREHIDAELARVMDVVFAI
jgi:putative DNA primase/helicase